MRDKRKKKLDPIIKGAFFPHTCNVPGQSNAALHDMPLDAGLYDDYPGQFAYRDFLLSKPYPKTPRV